MGLRRLFGETAGKNTENKEELTKAKSSGLQASMNGIRRFELALKDLSDPQKLFRLYYYCTNNPIPVVQLTFGPASLRPKYCLKLSVTRLVRVVISIFAKKQGQGFQFSANVCNAMNT